MSTKMVKYWRNKAVIVSVYVERPKRKSLSSANNRHDHDHHHHHHHHYVHRSIKQEATLRKPDAGKGYDRRAELLLYSQRLRESARPALDVAAEHSSLQPKPKPTSSMNLQPTSNIVAVGTKPKLARAESAPACLGNWKICFPSFLGSLTSPQSKKPKKKKKHNGYTSNAMKAVMKGIEMPKKKGFISKMLSTLRMHR